MKKRVISLLLALSMLLALATPGFAADVPSSWANNAVTWLKETGMLEAADFTDYGRTVTRADFARLGVILYELITRRPKPDIRWLKNPFTDTNDPDVLRAYMIDLVKGTGGTTFTPNQPVNREQIATMLLRVLDACDWPYSQDSTAAITFSDEADLSPWAADAVKRAYLIQIMNGTGGSAMSPQMTVTREQAYQMLYNIYFNREAIRNGKTRTISTGSVGTISLKYTDGGRYPLAWCEDAYHASPVVVDIDNDGALEILAASYSVVCLDAATGAVEWRFPVGKDRSFTTDGTGLTMRTWPDLYVGDVDNDGYTEIVAGHGSSTGGMVAVYDCNGYYEPGWPKSLPAEVCSIEVADLDGDGTMEIAAGISIPDGTNVYVFEHDGTLRAGWPQLSDANSGAKTRALESDAISPSLGFAWGIFNDNIAIGDIDGDDVPEIVVPSDVAQIAAYKPDGTQVRTALHSASALSAGVTDAAVWARVGVFSNAQYEAQVHNGGFGRVYDSLGNSINVASLPLYERLTAHFTHSKAVIDDLDGNGTNEVVIVGNIHDRKDIMAQGSTLAGLYQELFIFNGDHTRFNDDWAVEPTVKDGPLSENWNTIGVSTPDPVCVDLDGDGQKEILYADYSGKLNCYWLDHTQHDNWPLNVYDGTTMEYAAPPTTYDLDGDGTPEIIFATHTYRQGTKRGSLCIADAKGNLLQRVELPKTTDTSNKVPNGCLSAPVVTDLDGDGKVEILLHTYLSGVTVYDLD
ncbi:MAG: FG-GAP-like repeat-containing protein [Roseburia sp.]|nr:FG-GAP-like repeat-containing protein [Roseburia sp.]